MVSPLMFEILARDSTRSAFDSAGGNADRFAARARSSGQAASQGLQAVNGNVANLAAQFQDIGVQMQSGTSPLTIALQQGTQIGAVLGPLGAGGAVRALGSAFLSVVSPVNLLTIGVIAAGAAAFQYFSSFGDDAENATGLLQEQEELIGRVVQRWGEAAPALQAYLDQVERVRDISELLEASDAAAKTQFDGLSEKLQELNPQFIAAMNSLRGIGAEQTVVRDLGNAFGELRDKLDEGTATAQDMERVQKALAETLNSYGTPALIALNSALGNIIASFDQAINRADKFRNIGPAIASRYPSQGAYDNVERSADGNIQNGGFTLPENGPRPGSRPLVELEGIPYTKPPREGKSDEEKQVEKIEKVMQALEDERQMVTMNRTEQRILTAQRRANVDATSEQGQAIADLITKIDSEAQAYKAAEKAADFMRDNLRDSFMQLVPEIETGNKALDSFINRLIQASVEAAFFGSGPLGGIFGGGGLFGFGGGRAVGGGVDPWTDYQVGENGPEIVRIGAKGGVVGSRASADEGGLHVNFAPVINAPGADRAGLQQIRRDLSDMKKSLPKVIRGEMATAQTRKTRAA